MLQLRLQQQTLNVLLKSSRSVYSDKSAVRVEFNISAFF